MEVPAVRLPRSGRAAICIAVLVLAADQISKALVVAVAPRGPRGGLVAVRLVPNTAASFGIGVGHPVLVTVVAAAVLAAALIWLVRTGRPGLALCLAVVAGGAAGNLADRLLRSPGPGRGAVVDWIHVAGYPATFNLADVAIRAGAADALVATLAAGQHAARQPRGAASFAGERCDAANRARVLTIRSRWLHPARPPADASLRQVLTCFSRSALCPAPSTADRPCPRQMRTTSPPKRRCLKYTGRPLARWTITGGAQAVNYAKPG